MTNDDMQQEEEEQQQRRSNEENLLTRYIYNEDLYNQTDEHGIDIITLRYTLFQCRKQVLFAIKSLLDTEFAYSKIELREDFDKLKNQYNNAKIEYDLLKTNFDDIIDQCKILIQQTSDILTERNDYYSEWEYAKAILTPRPDWDKCSRLVINWRTLSMGKTSDELVDVCINEIICGNTEENHEEYLPIISNNNFEKGQILNRRMRRRITGLLIKEIWDNKLGLKSNVKLIDYVFNYLIKRFDNRDIAIEMNSNLQDACHRYRNHYEINLFWQIVIGQMEENIYHHEMKEFARILQYFIKISSKISLPSSSWTISWANFSKILHELYPNWSQQRLSSLIQAAQQDIQEFYIEKNDLQFMLLFMEDDEGHIGHFLLTIRELLNLDKMEYIEKIKDLLIGHPLVSTNQFKQVVYLVDPNISKEELQRYVNWGDEILTNETSRNPEYNQGLEQGDIVPYPHFRTITGRGVAIASAYNYRWANATIPYVFAENITSARRTFIEQQMREIEQLTMVNNTQCVKFRSQTSYDSYFITIFNGSGCSAPVGSWGSYVGVRPVSLLDGWYSTCMISGIVQHELTHVLGFFHEQSRPDRDEYVSIQWNNIVPAQTSNFIKYNSDVDTQMTPYDYGSVMHYGRNAFAINSSGSTIIPIMNDTAFIGQRVQLSPIDILEIQRTMVVFLHQLQSPQIPLPEPPRQVPLSQLPPQLPLSQLPPQLFHTILSTTNFINNELLTNLVIITTGNTTNACTRDKFSTYFSIFFIWLMLMTLCFLNILF
ncbi:hypothetical protein I4U23_012558 [Adineta vaga]|nr:hypothetical protein I4U23_012558 [Adineta vaga]